MFDYFMGGKKSEEVMQNNKMFREKMAMLKDASYLTDNKVKKMQQDWCKYIENSNIQLSVLSFNQKYIDEKIIEGGMIPKVQSCKFAIENGVESVHILDGRLEHSLLLEIFTHDGIGTMVEK